MRSTRTSRGSLLNILKNLKEAETGIVLRTFSLLEILTSSPPRKPCDFLQYMVAHHTEDEWAETEIER